MLKVALCIFSSVLSVRSVITVSVQSQPASFLSGQLDASDLDIPTKTGLGTPSGLFEYSIIMKMSSCRNETFILSH